MLPPHSPSHCIMLWPINTHSRARCCAGIEPEQIDILVTNCSIYCPTPSLASMLVNKFKLRQDVQAYHLGGMGCGNGVMALGLLKDLLQVGRPGGRRWAQPAPPARICAGRLLSTRLGAG